MFWRNRYHWKEHLKGNKMAQISEFVAPSSEELLIRCGADIYHVCI